MFKSKIKFSRLSDNELKQISKFTVTMTEELSSNYLGATVDNDCLTCGLTFKECPGHFGIYEFSFPLVHPLLTHEARIMLKKEKMMPRVFQNTLQIKESGSWKTFTALDVDKSKWQSRYFRKLLPISALHVRPACVTPGTNSGVSQNDITHRLAALIRLDRCLRSSLQNNDNNAMEHARLLSRLQVAYNLLFFPPPGNQQSRELSCLSQRFKGKQGRCRSTLLGKRVDYSARSVISSDSFIGVDEVGLPLEMCQKLTLPEYVTSWNITHMQKLLLKKQVRLVERHGKMINPTYRYNMFPQVGDIFHRHLRKGDYVLCNRQPTLWASSIQAMKVVPMEIGKTVRLNVDVTPPFNADFDGDEMCIFAVQSIDSLGELSTLMSTKEHILRGGVGIVQDSALCLWILSNENPCLGKRLFFDCLLHVKNNFDLKTIHNYSGRELIETLLPNDLSVEGIIENGKVIAGINKKVAKKHILTHLYKKSKQNSIHFLNALQRIAAEYFARRGFSVGLSCLEPDRIHLITNESNNMDVSGDDWEIIRRGMQYKEKKAHLAKSILTKGNRFLKLTSERSGAKGSLLNIIQMLSSLGQQFFKGGLINNYRKSEKGNRVLSTDKFNDKRMDTRGYIQSAFLKGLNPQELFLHAISSRLSLLDTALKTATSGYASRRLWKSMEDAVIHHDYSLRCNKRVLMFHVDKNALKNIDIQPGYPAGLEAAQNIGQNIMQLTLNTFHMAGTNNTTVVEGVPRLESLINVWSKKQEQQRVIYQENMSPWDAHKIILEDDTMYVKDLKPSYSFIHFKKKYNDRAPKSIRFKFDKKKCIRSRVTMWHIEASIYNSPLSKYCIPIAKDYKLTLIIQTPKGEEIPLHILKELKSAVLNLKIRGHGQKVFYHAGRLERKGIQLQDAMQGKEWKQIKSSSIIETLKVFGIAAAKDQLITELNKVFNHAVAAFHIQCLAEWMCNKGTLNSTTRAGIANFYDEENVLKSMAFERALRTASKAASKETVATFGGLSERVLINKTIKTGSGFCDVIHDNKAFTQYQNEIEEKKQKEIENKRQREENEDSWVINNARPCKARPVSPAYSPFRPAKPVSPAYSPFRPAKPLSPAYSPFRAKPVSPAYSPFRPTRPVSPAYSPFRANG